MCFKWLPSLQTLDAQIAPVCLEQSSIVVHELPSTEKKQVSCNCITISHTYNMPPEYIHVCYMDKDRKSQKNAQNPM